MKSKEEVQKQLEYFRSFGKNKQYPADRFYECMGTIMLEEILEHYSSEEEIKEFIESELKKINESFQQNKANLRGFAEGFKIEHCLWVLDAKLEDYFDENDNLII